eukprot:TRINITY_DN25982_c0_g1_i2.p1 TRINITY_DN25982_c0_g1~~TRINITY_DN25982_c0_g1_i2.p1  ORF type:complete len:715 (-),score=148.09 TRINITY_DN25982_c0_g1_i2:72-2216(-)
MALQRLITPEPRSGQLEPPRVQKWRRQRWLPASCFECFGPACWAGLRAKRHKVFHGYRGDAYRDCRSLAEAIYAGDVVLIKGRWLLDQYAASAPQVQSDIKSRVRAWFDEFLAWTEGDVPQVVRQVQLPRRQDLPPEAIWQPEEILPRLDLANHRLKIVAISHAWLAEDHPDPTGTHLLNNLAPVLDQWLAYYSQEFGWDIAIFLDWCSLHQHPRTPQEEASFQRALQSAHLWYAHEATDVWVIGDVPGTASRTASIAQRGWPTFERGAGGLNPHGSSVFDLSLRTPTCTTWESTELACTLGQDPILVPDAFAEVLASKSFSKPLDLELTAAAYAKAFSDMMSSVSHLFLENSGWRQKEAEALARALPSCLCLRSLYLGGNCLGDEGAAALARGLPTCEGLKALNLEDNFIRYEGALALAEALPACHLLNELNLSRNRVGAAGVKALAPALSSCRSLGYVALSGCGVEDAGASCLADVLPSCGALVRLALRSNDIGDAGASAIAHALPQSPQLGCLLLDDNALGDVAAQVFAEHLPHAQRLETLSLRRTKIYDAGAEALAAAIPRCSAQFVSLSLGETSLTERGRQQLMEAWLGAGRPRWGLCVKTDAAPASCMRPAPPASPVGQSPREARREARRLRREARVNRVRECLLSPRSSAAAASADPASSEATSFGGASSSTPTRQTPRGQAVQPRKVRFDGVAEAEDNGKSANQSA